MTGNLQVDGVQSRQTLFVRYCLRSNGSVNFEWGSERVSRTTLYPFCSCVVRGLSDCPSAATSQTENITQFSRFSCFCSCITDNFYCPSTVYSTCYLLFFAAKLRKDRIQRKEYIVVIIEAPEKWKPQILLGISGRSFPQTPCGKFPEKWKAFFTREKWKVCGVENKSLWKKSWKTCRIRNAASTSCGKHIPQLSTTDSTSPLLQLSNAADTAGTFSAYGFSTDC